MRFGVGPRETDAAACARMGAVSATRRKMALVSAALVLASAGDVGAVKVAIRATAALDARVTPDGEAQVIRGTLRDDVGAAVPGAHVEVTVLTEAGKRVDLPPPRPCSTTAGGHAPHAAPDAYVLDTDGQGLQGIVQFVGSYQGPDVFEILLTIVHRKVIKLSVIGLGTVYYFIRELQATVASLPNSRG